MDKKEYECIDCKTKKFLIFPKHNESFIICSACYRIRNEKKDLIKCACSVCERHNEYLNKIKNEKQ
jgi:hypothetical protein